MFLKHWFSGSVLLFILCVLIKLDSESVPVETRGLNEDVLIKQLLPSNSLPDVLICVKFIRSNRKRKETNVESLFLDFQLMHGIGACLTFDRNIQVQH